MKIILFFIIEKIITKMVNKGDVSKETFCINEPVVLIVN